MRDEYDFTPAEHVEYVKREREKVTLQLDSEVVRYFKEEAARTGVSYQGLINFCLLEDIRKGKRLTYA